MLRSDLRQVKSATCPELPVMAEAEVVQLSSLSLDRSVGQRLPEALAHKISGVCIGQPDEQTLELAVADAGEISYYEMVEMGTQHRYRARLVQAEEAEIALAHEWIYRVPKAREDESWQQWMQSKRYQNQSLSVAQSGSTTVSEVTGEVVDRADRILKEAISLGASDIHLETYESGLVVRYRQDGVLQTADEIADLGLADAVIKRLKIMASMDITQGRVTQGGRISIEVAGRAFDLRVSILPVPAGESVVLRLLNKGAFNITLADLGLRPADQERYQWFIDHPHGLVLTSGPTGAGKTTTLYASLKSIQRPDRKLLTVEDPIEYQMPGIIQVQVNTAPRDQERRVTFASALREFLRHDPDVILVGEIRDEETAHTCVQAALTGHLVLSTIHTNDAVGIVSRLKDQGVKPYLIAATLVGGVAQRLIRRTCAQCAAPVEATPQQKVLLEKYSLPADQLRAGRGCTACRNTGYRGRLGIYEVLTITDAIRDLIEREGTSQQIRAVARADGMTSLLEDGLFKASQGLVNLAEVTRVCALEVAR